MVEKAAARTAQPWPLRPACPSAVPAYGLPLPLLLAPPPSPSHIPPLRPLLRHHPGPLSTMGRSLRRGPRSHSFQLPCYSRGCSPAGPGVSADHDPPLWKVTPREQHPGFLPWGSGLEEVPPACSELRVTGPAVHTLQGFPHPPARTPVRGRIRWPLPRRVCLCSVPRAPPVMAPAGRSTSRVCPSGLGHRK